MENTQLRPGLPWRRVMPGTYAAETPTGQKYMVEKTDEGWLVFLRGPRGSREVLGEPTRIKWVGQCRAEYHYQYILSMREAAEPKVSKPAMPPPEAVAAAAASLKTAKTPQGPKSAAPKAATEANTSRPPSEGASKDAKPPTSRRHRRPTAPPAKPAAPSAPLPEETLAWKTSRQKGREFHVAEHEGGLFKIIEVKGTEGFALFDEKSDGLVREIRCGSLDACKQTAASMFEGKAKAPRKAKAAAPAKDEPAPGKAAAPAKDEQATSKADAAEPATPKKGKRADNPAPAAPADPSRPAAKEPSANGACGCKHEETPEAPASSSAPRPGPVEGDRRVKLLEGLQSALRKMKPPTAEA